MNSVRHIRIPTLSRLPIGISIVIVVAIVSILSLMVSTEPTSARPWKRGIGHAQPIAKTAWQSGVYPRKSADVAIQFGKNRNRPVDIVEVFSARETWSTMKSNWWKDSVPSGTNVAIAVPMWPVLKRDKASSPTKKDEPATLEEAASGAYNADWKQWAEQVKAAGFQAPIIRLGWEFNVRLHWAAPEGKQHLWVQAYRQAHAQIKAVLPNAIFCWNPNSGDSPPGIVQNPTTAYPGDAYVDDIGFEAYDWWPAYVNEETWASHRDAPYGWNFWARFSREHGKTLSMPEWGLVRSSGDNPFYITKVHEFLSSQPNVRWESYFAEVNETHPQFDMSGSPKAFSKYKELWGRR